MSEQTVKAGIWTEEKRKAVYAALAAPFGEDAIQRTKATETRRSYDTTGIAYQYVVNRFNEVLGVGGFRVERKFSVEKGQYGSGKDKFTVHCEVKIQIGEWAGGEWHCCGEAMADGGHESITLADGVKGAYTNGFKKAAAFFGVGRQAYEGTLDDDNVPVPSGATAGFGGPAGSVSHSNDDPKARLLATRSKSEFAAVFDREVRPKGETVANPIWAATQAHYDALPQDAPAGRPEASTTLSFKFGKKKDVPLADLDDGDLAFYSGAMERDLADASKSQYHARTQKNLDAIRAEQAWRQSQGRRAA